jgi:hypothetical protein
MNFNKLLFFILLLSIISGCSHRLKEDKFILVYADLLISQDTLGARFNMNDAKNAVFKKHNISAREYDETLNYYNSNPGKWEPFFNNVIAHLESQKSKKGK